MSPVRTRKTKKVSPKRGGESSLFWPQKSVRRIVWMVVVDRRRIDTEEKTKVVAAVWGTYLNAALAM